MANTVVVSGSNYTVPDVGEKNWGQNVTDLLIALATAVPGNSGYLSYVSVASSPISIVSGKTYLVNTTGARTLNLPAAAVNAYFWIKDVSNLAATNNITIARNASESIDGVAANKTLSINGGSWYFVSDGTNWFMLRDVEAFNPKAATNQIVLTPGAFSVTITAPVPAAARVLTIPDPGTAASFLMTEGAQTVNGAKSFASSALKVNGASGGFAATIAGAAFAAGRTYTVPDALTSAEFLMTEGAQTVNGAKSFASSALKLNGVSGGFTATVAVAALAASRVYTVPDAGGAASFVMTEGAQTINGIKTLGSVLLGPNGAANAPTFSFSGDPDTGMFENGANQVGFSANGAIVMAITTAGLSLIGAASMSDGSVGTPAVNFISDPDTGIYSVGANDLGFVAGGARRADISSAGLRMLVDIIDNGAATVNIGTATNYFNDISYKTITDRGCLPWCDDGVELLDGRRVSDLEAICAIQKHPTRKTPTGLPRLDYRTFPKHAYKRVEDELKGELVERDAAGEAWVTREVEGKPKKVQAQDGVEMTMVFGLMIGSLKEISGRLAALESGKK